MIDSARYPRLARIQTPDDLRTFDESELRAVADELRAYLIESVGKSGGHFAAGLGVIELTVALHYLYQTPVDQLVWDVGHQTYPHKILTGRRDQIHTVKQKDGVAPFPKREESEYDTFGVGHSSTSISAALGMAIARQSEGDDRKIVAVIGDGAMTAGMAFEALMHAGGMDPEPNLLVILNDNNMSISEAVGGLTKMLGRATGSRTLNALREGGKKILGDKKNNPARFVKRWEEHWKGMFVPSTMFEEMGFHYTGPIDGHDMPALLSTLKTLRASKGPKLLHVMTTKGKGYEPAEGDQIGYHAVGPFDPDKGLVAKAGAKKPTYTDVFSDWLCDAAAAEPRLYGITPAMREGSGLVRFSKEYPQRYFDVAIAEQHAVTLAAGMATQGGKPVVAIYSTFLQRAYDQLVHDVAIQDLDVLFAIDRAGVVGPDGATHAGNLDLSFLRCVPNLVVMAPSNEAECRQMLSTGLQHPGPAAVRYPRGTGTGVAAGTDLSTLPIGKGELRLQGSRIALLAFGSTVAAAEQVGRELGLSVVNMRFIKPLDRELVLAVAAQHEGLVTIEDNVVAGGAGSGVGELLNAEGVLRPILHLGLPDSYQHHASREDLLAEAGIDAAGIRAAVLKRWPQLVTGTPPLSAAG
ncbi:TPA: 1-deoxy-D-xylulose-5-phosphate synthase [Stenotrophomonas maltophilia]|uniref:1-deoxy-D-xylulose-5-phosphate synthase n=3 Tax=Stenotrophomonas maltophilia TaxID=40324 RepID=DXS_STRMK|nr:MULTISPECIES: 1-deoxy-D-xylulose-5-phosphate synthase [Stenotrophomonas]B2FN57.1 RecName: Full=1-deoxy-D-xylulose-5-phosphate synthase; AltName: Full=1-deoxyxylulose-5-phosphate synthase; Short=DXP synthase; Short=DXPS [Stenotrophomonas maltophilia K279a]EKT4069910.1 1-deoxy-D-xylulose-5-phosphate synthase [Stenotrophomonas maltophilia]EKT4078692.1 1-deoxy-D-xylulose-5-phosphate synthase [Stenotrophomonas maltophilia]EKT4098225.1 1-deoxy-D-xylulose-5-phosphate synthase [Stenotrophomonas malt